MLTHTHSSFMLLCLTCISLCMHVHNHEITEYLANLTSLVLVKNLMPLAFCKCHCKLSVHPFPPLVSRVTYRGGNAQKLWCHNCLNGYNKVYNTIIKYSIIIGLAESDEILSLCVQNLIKIYKTLAGAPTHACTLCMHLPSQEKVLKLPWERRWVPVEGKACPPVSQRRHKKQCWQCWGWGSHGDGVVGWLLPTWRLLPLLRAVHLPQPHSVCVCVYACMMCHICGFCGFSHYQSVIAIASLKCTCFITQVFQAGLKN